ncbi:MAG: transporter substrate-binding domain-containing protein, partial [Pseudomonadota bacterium]
MRALRPYAIASLLLLALGRPAAGDGAEPATLIVANSAHWLPFAFLDHRGEPHGLLIDVWRLAAARSGLQLDPRLVDWEASLALVRDGVVPIHAGMTRTAERAEDYAFSQPILRVRTMVFADRAVELRDLARLENEGIGVVRGTVEEQFLAEHYPHLQIRGFADSDAMVEAAVEGELVGFVADYPSGHYRLIRHEALDRFEAVHSLYTDTIHAAVPRGADDLLLVIDAVLGRVEAEDIAAIERRWLIPGEPWPSWLLPAGGAVLAVFAGLGLLGHERTLRRRVAHRTDDLARALANLEAANAELDRLANVDPLTGLANRRRFLEVAEQEIARARRHDRTVTLVLLDVDR